MSSLQYSHLDRSRLQIRLLTLLPAEASKKIRCKLQISSLLDYPLFQALSYQWGPSNEKRQILVNNVMFEVTDNLYAALRQLRGRCERRILWIDQICINQTDKEEQKHQVGLMRRIYSQCSVALLWLGKNRTIHQHVPLSVLKDLGDMGSWVYADTQEPADLCRNRLKGMSLLFSMLHSGHIYTHPFCQVWQPEHAELKNSLLLAMKEIATSGWWSRIWTVQECVLPRQAMLVHGPLMVSWSTALEVFKLMRLQFGNNQDCCERRCSQAVPSVFLKTSLDFLDATQLLGSLRQKQFSSDNIGLSDLIEYIGEFSNRHAEDPRDKIYGLLGLVNDWGDSSAIEAEYSLPVEEVYRRFSFAAIHRTKNLNIFHYLVDPWREGVISSSLPSWVIDWRTQSAEILMDRFSQAIHSKGSTGLPCYINCCSLYGHDVPNNLLGLSGLVLDESITLLGDPIKPDDDLDMSFLQWWNNYCGTFGWSKFLLDFSSTYSKAFLFGGILLGGTWATNFSSDRHRSPYYNAINTFDINYLYTIDYGFAKLTPNLYDAMNTTIWGGKGERSGLMTQQVFERNPYFNWAFPPDETFVKSNFTLFERSLRVATTHRRLIHFKIKEWKLYGLAPATTQVGDKVCFYCGGRTAFLLRPVDGSYVGGNGVSHMTYKLIGDILMFYISELPFHKMPLFGDNVENLDSITTVFIV